MASRDVGDVVELLMQRADELSSKLALRYLVTGDVDGGIVEWSYADVHRRAQFVASRLAEVTGPGARALLLFAPGLDFVSAFFGCLYAGVIAVPVYPPDPARLPQTLPRLEAIVTDAGADIVLTTTDVLMMTSVLGQIAPDLVALRWLTVDDVAADFVSTFNPWRPAPDDIAFLQYTSGSTGEPKGVIVTHANIIHNERMVQAAISMTADEHVVGWLPLFHDLGLIGNILQTLWVGSSVTLMSPVAFLKQPMRWLRAMSHYRGIIAGGPDFSYDLCARKVTSADLETLDLRHWRIAFSSAEPVRASTIDRFRNTFARVGFDPRAFLPGFGLAEATLAVTCTAQPTLAPIRHFDPVALGRGNAVLVEDGAAQAYVSSGRPMPSVRLAIVEPEQCTRLSEGLVGEIWMQGPSMAKGYWGKKELSAEVFAAKIRGENDDGWVRTGDLGFVFEGELYVTGRRKDLIIVRGQNHYPQDIERTAELAARVLRPGCSAAFSMDREGAEIVVLCAEVDGAPEDLREALSAIEAAVLDAHQLSLDDIVLIRPRTVRKTSSGKIQRYANKAAYLAGEHDIVMSLRGVRSVKPTQVSPDVPARSESRPVDVRAVEMLLLSALQETIGGGIAPPSPETTFASLGVDSLKIADVAGALEKSLGFEIPLEIFYGETIAGVARLIAERRDPRGVVARIDWNSETALPESLVPGRMHEPGAGPILLTGATGFVGAALLDELLARTERKIICLVRATDSVAGLQRIRDALKKIGRRDDFVDSRVVALCGDLVAPRFGLTKSVFSDLANRVNAIYHCGAVVHWTEPFRALRPANVNSVREVLSLAAPRNIAIHHVSTLGIYPFTSADGGVFSEEGDAGGIEHLRLGYFQSKWVADTMLTAARRRGFVVSIYRPGLVTGDSRTGFDAPAGGRILGAFLAGCVRMGLAPYLDKVLDVVPVDYVAAAIAAISLRSGALGRSFNLINPQPMRQLELYAALRDMGFALREVPYQVWQKAVISLPQTDPDNPLARFALYYRTMTEERMRHMERRTAVRLPVDDRNTRALLPASVACPPFDRQLLSTYVRYEQAMRTMPENDRTFEQPVGPAAYSFVERYAQEDDRISKLYGRGKERQWDAVSRLDWTHELDPDNPEKLPDTSLPIYGSPIFERMDLANKARVRRHFQSWQLSQTLHGEQGALLCASKIVQQVPSVEARLYAATQVADEARHVELFSRLLQDKIGVVHPMTPPLRALLDNVLSDNRWDMTFLGMQVLVEGLALAAFSLSRDQSKDPLVAAAYAYVVEDEARHVAFGRLALKDYYPQLSQAELDEREEFVVEAAYLLRDRLQGDEIWADLGLPTAEVLVHASQSGFQRNYRRELFSRIVPLVRAIGLWGSRVRSAFADMGVLGFAQVDLDALAAADEQQARRFEKRSQ